MSAPAVRSGLLLALDVSALSRTQSRLKTTASNNDGVFNLSEAEDEPASLQQKVADCHTMIPASILRRRHRLQHQTANSPGNFATAELFNLVSKPMTKVAWAHDPGVA
ncbi:hypothetical protein FB451DRAFT_1417137 [Mycena latifolia]|nr:hypothetical protein FB451DRAFT_1417137 [Mycena latifolia]